MQRCPIPLSLLLTAFSFPIHRSSQRKCSLGKPDQRELSENLAATQGLAHMITECNRLFQVWGLLSHHKSRGRGLLPGAWGQLSIGAAEGCPLSTGAWGELVAIMLCGEIPARGDPPVLRELARDEALCWKQVVVTAMPVSGHSPLPPKPPSPHLIPH